MIDVGERHLRSVLSHHVSHMPMLRRAHDYRSVPVMKRTAHCRAISVFDIISVRGIRPGYRDISFIRDIVSLWDIHRRCSI